MISIILMEPRHPGNLGAIARAMQNFGFNSLYLVDPLCSEQHPEAIRRAKHALPILKNVKRISKDELVSTFHTLVATTAKVGTSFNLPRAPLHPDELSRVVCKYANSNKNIGIIFGRETDGLHNDEIKLADFSVTIPTPLENPTLNLSHAVAILLYELSKSISVTKTTDHIDLISGADKKQMNKMVGEILSTITFERADHKQTQHLVWKRLFSKSFLTKREAFALMGFFKHVLKKMKKN